MPHQKLQTPESGFLEKVLESLKAGEKSTPVLLEVLQCSRGKLYDYLNWLEEQNKVEKTKEPSKSKIGIDEEGYLRRGRRQSIWRYIGEN